MPSKLKQNHRCQYQNCDYETKQKSHLTRHIELIHEKKEKIKCPLCENTYQTNSNLKKHHETFHENLKKYQCNICHKYFTTDYKRKAHEKKQICEKNDEMAAMNSSFEQDEPDVVEQRAENTKSQTERNTEIEKILLILKINPSNLKKEEKCQRIIETVKKMTQTDEKSLKEKYNIKDCHVNVIKMTQEEIEKKRKKQMIKKKSKARQSAKKERSENVQKFIESYTFDAWYV